jgi:cyanophycin synthetase
VVLEVGMNGHMITIYDKGNHIPLLWTHLIPATVEGRAMHNVQNAMFAAAIAYSMGVKLEDIRHGLQSFDTTFFQAPGRGNIFNEHPFKVILDYGHNAPAIEAMVQLADKLEADGRKIVVIAAPGDRRDEDIRDIAAACAGHFDHYICRRDDRLRGRDGDEVPRLQYKALVDAGVDPAAIEIIPDEVESVDRALRMAAPGDLVLIFGDAISRTWDQITHFSPDLGETPSREPATPPPLDIPQVPALGTWDSLVRDERGVRVAREEDD